MKPRRILVTAGLPYANGPIHIGHLVEYLQTDIWVRFQKLRGNRCLFFCGDDTHGTAIMMSAQKAGVSETEFIAKIQKEHEADFSAFDIEFDNFSNTNSSYNRALCEEFWQALNDAGLIVEKEISQLFDIEAKTFLADRFVKGTCPNPSCGAENQHGDSCSQCLTTYSPTDLINPVSTLSGATPEVKTAKHLFVNIEKLHPFLEEWTQSGNHLQSEVANYLKGHFLGKPLRDWDVSRPARYFGFEIPDHPGHYWFVWFDAPIGYIASTQEWCERNGEEIEDWWKDSQTEIHHFIGKDITYFHTLFWPAMLKTAGYNLPTKVHIHGFLTVDGKKMSKSEGTFIRASVCAKHLDPAYIRYYYASKLGPKLDDLDLNREELVSKVNSDLVGKVVNLASRSAKFITELSASYPDDGGLFKDAADAGPRIAELYESCDFNGAMREIMSLADRANKFIEEAKPWEMRKVDSRQSELQDVCTIALNLFRQIVIYISPVLPSIKLKTEELLQQPILSWSEVQQPVVSNSVSKFKHMLKRVEEKQVTAMIEESKVDEPDANESNVVDSAAALENEPLTDECTFDDFIKVDMRVARVISAKEVEESNKLLQLTVSLGGSETRNVFAGLKGVYSAEDLQDRLVIFCANLAPRKMRFGISEGMVLAAGPGGKEIFLLNPDAGAVPGQRVH